MRISDWSSDVCSSDLPGDDLEVALRNLKHTASKRQPPRCPPVPRKAELIKYGPHRGGRRMILPCDMTAVVHSNRVKSEERRGGKACVSPCGSRWSPYH